MRLTSDSKLIKVDPDWHWICKVTDDPVVSLHTVDGSVHQFYPWDYSSVVFSPNMVDIHQSFYTDWHFPLATLLFIRQSPISTNNIHILQLANLLRKYEEVGCIHVVMHESSELGLTVFGHGKTSEGHKYVVYVDTNADSYNIEVANPPQGELPLMQIGIQGINTTSDHVIKLLRAAQERGSSEDE